MGELVLSSEVKEMSARTDPPEIKDDGGGNPAVTTEAAAAVAGDSSSLVRWERFLPKLVVRVLLVEADDSTRQIIAALLRKCSYKVAAVSDGLKAWEILQARGQNIDLILTEVDLTSISGYALLTLIMEHNICKKIPVIMMSAHDSVGIVYKCMMRGAADFLVKPIRKNELRNLWQHVWRKQASSGVCPGPPDENMAQQKIEATAENNANSNHSSGYMACIQRNRECIEKGTDAQSSCTKPELENDEPDVEHGHSLSQTKKFLSIGVNVRVHKDFQEESTKTRAQHNEAGELQNVAKEDANSGETGGQDKNSWERVNVTGKNSKNNHAREAIDLIGAFGNCCKGTLDSPTSNDSTNKFDISPQLDLSLRRSHPSGSVNQVYDETHGTNHSDASAFSRYVNKPFQLRNSTSPSTCNQQKDLETNSEKKQSNHTPEYNSDAHGPRISSQNYASANVMLSGPTEATFFHPQLRELSQPIPVRGVRFENVTNGFGAMMPQLYCVQSNQSPLPSPGTTSHSPSFTYLNPSHPSNRQPTNYQNGQNLLDQRFSSAMDQTDNKQGQKLESLEDPGRVSFANDQSPNNCIYSCYRSHHNSTGSGDNGKINSTSVVKATSEAASEEGPHVQESASHRSMHREAALTKFRLKRKERCFEKKVRYESRRKLAEQRPRVKGQFVRQIPNEPQPGSSSPDELNIL